MVEKSSDSQSASTDVTSILSAGEIKPAPTPKGQRTVEAGEKENEMLRRNSMSKPVQAQRSGNNYPSRQKVSAASDKKCFVKIVAIGDSGVGKTSLIQMFEHSRFTENFKPTIGADFSNKEI